MRVGVHGIIVYSDDEGGNWTQSDQVFLSQKH